MSDMSEYAVALFFPLFFVAVSVWAGLTVKATNFSWVRFFISLALLPTALALWANTVFALTSWIAPGAFIYIGGLVVTLAVSVFEIFRRINVRIGASLPSRSWSLLQYFCFAVILLPLLAAVLTHALRIRIDHDISVYFIEASALSIAMREGFSHPLDWLGFSRPPIIHPHTLSFTHYLALGFLNSSTPGYGHDLAPRLLIGLVHLSFLSALAAVPLMVLRRYGYLAVYLTLALLVFEAAWLGQILWASRDTFYTAPLLVVIAIVLTSRPGFRGWGRTLVFSLAVYGTISGHSLGIIYIVPVFAAAGLLKLYWYRLQCLKIPEFWIGAAGVAVAAAFLGAKYFGGKASNIGFVYPYYATDPALQKYWEERQTFLFDPNLFYFIREVFSGNDGLQAACILGFVGIILSLISLLNRNVSLRTWCHHMSPALQIMLILIFLVTFIFLLPIHLDGITLPGAFVTNLRYGFGLKVLILLGGAFLFLSAAGLILSGKVVKERSWLVYRLTVPAFCAAILVAIFVGGWNSLINAQAISAEYAGFAQQEAASCDYVANQGARFVYLDYDSMIYRCSVPAGYLLTEMGARVLSAKGDADIDAALEEQNVDAVIFHRDYLGGLWKDSRIVDFLERNWVRNDDFERITVFTRGD